MLKFLIRWGSCLLSSVVSCYTVAETVYIAHCQSGCPIGAPPANEIVVRHLFAASINSQTSLADWVAYRVLRDSIGVASLLPRVWQADALLDRELMPSFESGPRFSQPDLSNQQDRDYRVNEVIVNEVDRGRLVPMSAFAGTPFWEDLNYLSNMSPIPNELRLGPWSRLDGAINELAARVGEVYVVSGPLYQGTVNLADSSSAGNQPIAYFKYVVAEDSTAVFIFRHDLSQHSAYCDQQASLQELQQRSELVLRPQANPGNTTSLYRQLGCTVN